MGRTPEKSVNISTVLQDITIERSRADIPADSIVEASPIMSQEASIEFRRKQMENTMFTIEEEEDSRMLDDHFLSPNASNLMNASNLSARRFSNHLVMGQRRNTGNNSRNRNKPLE